MQIGYPTDVKHVAHIGWDGPSVNPPSWVGTVLIRPSLLVPLFDSSEGLPRLTMDQMNEFRSAPLSTLGAEAMADQAPARFSSQGRCQTDTVDV